jgi:hypothetical protein
MFLPIQKIVHEGHQTIVVLVHKHGGYEIEFMTLGGETIAVVLLFLEQVRPVGHREIAHARLVTLS